MMHARLVSSLFHYCLFKYSNCKNSSWRLRLFKPIITYSSVIHSQSICYYESTSFTQNKEYDATKERKTAIEVRSRKVPIILVVRPQDLLQILEKIFVLTALSHPSSVQTVSASWTEAGIAGWALVQDSAPLSADRSHHKESLTILCSCLHPHFSCFSTTTETLMFLCTCNNSEISGD
jgi:hypothetical protein